MRSLRGCGNVSAHGKQSEMLCLEPPGIHGSLLGSAGTAGEGQCGVWAGDPWVGWVLGGAQQLLPASTARTVGAVTALCHRCLQEAQMWSGAEQSLGFAKPASPCVAPRKAERCACRCTWHVQAAWWGCLLPSCPAACLQREETATGLLCLHIRCWPAPHLPAEVVNDTQAQEGPVSILLLLSCQGPLDPHGGVVR